MSETLEQTTLTETEKRDVVDRIAAQLGETQFKPRRQLTQLIERCGVEFVEKVLKETIEVEANGGVLVESGDRRRTIGGVFFYLARKHLPDDVRDEIFHIWRHNLKRKEAFESQFPSFEWEKRAEILPEILAAQKGEVSDVKISLMGRPGAIERRQNLVITSMEYQVNEQYSLPAGVPEPPLTPMTFVVYISAKQWERVEKAIQAPDDELIVEGLCAFDDQVDGLAVFTTYATTRKTQRKERKELRRQQGPDNGKPAARPGGKKPTFKDKSAENGPQKSAGLIEVIKEPATIVPEFDVPQDAPPPVVQKLTELHTAAATFRQKISALEAKPADQQVGLEMTRKLLKTTEKQIEALEKQYASNP